VILLYICPKCGSMEWREGGTSTHVYGRICNINEDGEVDEGDWDDITEYDNESDFTLECNECANEDLISLDKLSKESLKKLANTEPNERIKLLPKLMVIDEL